MTAAPDVNRSFADSPDPVCVGVLAADPLRLIGLQAILQENLELRTAVMDPADVLLTAEHCVALAELGAGRLLRDDASGDAGSSGWTPDALARSLTTLVLDGVG